MTSDPQELRDGPKPGARDTLFLDDNVPGLTEELLRAVVTLTQELSVTRDRLARLEAATGQSADAVTLPPEAEKALAGQRMALVDAVLGPITARMAKNEA